MHVFFTVKMYFYPFSLLLIDGVNRLNVLEIRDLQNLAKLGAGWKALFTRSMNEEIKRFLNTVTILMSMVFP